LELTDVCTFSITNEFFVWKCKEDVITVFFAEPLNWASKAFAWNFFIFVFCSQLIFNHFLLFVLRMALRTQNDRDFFVDNGYKFVYDKASKKDGSILFWRCEFKNKGCPARIHTQYGTVIERMHNHAWVLAWFGAQFQYRSLNLEYCLNWLFIVSLPLCFSDCYN